VSIWLRVYLFPPGTAKPRTVPPSAMICLKTRNSASLKMSESSQISRPQRRSGLSDPYFAIAYEYGIRRIGVSNVLPISWASISISGSTSA